MTERRREIHFESRFDHPLEAVWPVFADTERLNQATGTPWMPYTAEEILQPDGSVLRHAKGRMGRYTVRWREDFGEWVEGSHIRQERHFENGPVRELTMDIRLAESGDGCVARYTFIVSWTSLLGGMMNALGLMRKITRPIVITLERLVAEAMDGPVATDTAPAIAPPEPGVLRRIDEAIARVDANRYSHGLGQRLKRHLIEANPIDLRRIRPLELAGEWEVEPRDLVELCLAAHTAGLMSMRWEIMCPRCRGGKAGTDNLSELAGKVHCPSCNIDYERDFVNNVELVFAPEPWLRALPQGDFCMMGPASTPHVKLQCDVEPGQTRTEAIELPPGQYRLRTLEAGGQGEIYHDGGPFPEVIVAAGTVEPGLAGHDGEVVMHNDTGHRRTVVVESTALSELALTGPRVIAAPAFRALCPEQLLRPGDEVGIGRVAILFSDLKGSTALYEAIGDSRAYVLVREHFEFLEERIHRQGGTIVKTIGDAVMAAFPAGADALGAALDIQASIAGFNEGRDDGGVELKIGLNEGQSIAVTSHRVLDYFGSTINLAARLQGESRGGEIMLSTSIHDAPGARRLLEGCTVEPRSVMLSGFSEPVSCYLIPAAGGGGEG